jgi:hypothetical protein
MDTTPKVEQIALPNILVMDEDGNVEIFAQDANAWAHSEVIADDSDS